MALTAWEAVKVVGKTVESLGTKGDEFETANPDKKYTPTVGDITSLVVETMKDLGTEIMD